MKRILVLFLAVFALGMTSCNKRIDAGNEGILVKLYGTERGVQDVNLVTGRVFFNPFSESVYEFPTYVQTYDYPDFTVNAKDGSVFTVDPTLSFGVKAGATPEIFRKYRKDINAITSTTLFNHIRDAFRIEFNKYTTDEIISSREKFEDNIQKNLFNILDKEGFYLEQMTSGIQYPQSITNAINQKNEAIQKSQMVENQLRIAEAEAKKMIVLAEAEAKANELKRQSLNHLLIQQQFIEKWDGKSSLYGETPLMHKAIK